jgi:hypothetical protein
MSAAEIARSAMEIAASLCIYTNQEILLYTLENVQGSAEPAATGTNGATVTAD